MTVGRWAAPVATLLFATSPALIYFAAETKQYSSDVTCVILALLVTAPLLRKTPSIRSAVIWGVSCSALSWCSFPAIAIAALCGFVLAARWVRNVRALLALAAAAIILLANVLGQYIVTLQELSRNTSLDSYWQGIGGYPRQGANLSSDVTWLHNAGFAVLSNPVHVAFPWLVLAVVIWGVLLIGRRSAEAAVLVCRPLIAGIALAMTHHYPMSRRLALYLIPSVLLLISAGAVGLYTIAVSLVPRSRIALLGACAMTTAVLVLTAGETIATGVDKLVRPDEVTAGREAVHYIVDHRQAGDIVLVEAPWGLANLIFYGPRLGVSANGSFRFTGTGCGRDPLAVLRGSRRVWLLLAHHGSNEPLNRTEIFLSHFETRATLLRSYFGPGDAGSLPTELL